MLRVDARTCPVCGAACPGAGWMGVAAHLVAEGDASDARHVMWMNRTLTKHRTPAPALAALLEAVFDRGEAPERDARVRR